MIPNIEAKKQADKDIRAVLRKENRTYIQVSMKDLKLWRITEVEISIYLQDNWEYQFL